jgi:putative PIN family toxin of toxin-antitoxin system
VKVVFDTNVFIAALLTQGLCSRLLHRARAGEFALEASPFIMGEVHRTLSRKFKLTREEIAWSTTPVVEAVSRIIEPEVVNQGICSDADDDNILACAVTARAEYLVTGDSELLKLGSFQGVTIVSPRDFEALFL